MCEGQASARKAIAKVARTAPWSFIIGVGPTSNCLFFSHDPTNGAVQPQDECSASLIPFNLLVISLFSTSLLSDPLLLSISLSFVASREAPLVQPFLSLKEHLIDTSLHTGFSYSLYY